MKIINKFLLFVLILSFSLPFVIASESTAPDVVLDSLAYQGGPINNYVDVGGNMMLFVGQEVDIKGTANDTDSDLENWTIMLENSSGIVNASLCFNTSAVDGTLCSWNTSLYCSGECENYTLVLNATDSTGKTNSTFMENITIDNILPVINMTTDVISGDASSWLERANISDRYLKRVDALVFNNSDSLIISWNYLCNESDCDWFGSGFFNMSWFGDFYSLNETKVPIYYGEIFPDFQDDMLAIVPGCISINGSEINYTCREWRLVYNLTAHDQNNYSFIGLSNENECDKTGCYLNNSLIQDGITKFKPQNDYLDRENGIWTTENTSLELALYAPGDLSNLPLEFNISEEGIYTFAFRAWDYWWTSINSMTDNIQLGQSESGGINSTTSLTMLNSGRPNLGDIIMFLINVTNTGSTNISNLSLFDEFNTIYNYSNASLTPDAVDYVNHVISWNNISVNLSEGQSYLLYVNFSALLTNNAMNRVNSTVYSSEDSSTVSNYLDFQIGENIPPDIIFMDSTTNQEGNYSRNAIWANVTVSDSSPISSVTIFLFNSSGLYNLSTFIPDDPENNTFFFNFTNLPERTFRLNATVNDTWGNINSTGTKIIVLDRTEPTIDIISPTNQTYYNATQLVNISSNGNYIWFFNGTDNQTYIEPIYVTFPEGTNTLTAWANDSAGNINTTNIEFIVNTTIPYNFTCDSLINSSGTYTLTYDLLNCSENGINITASNVTLDCLGHSISGTGSGDGIYSKEHDYITIKNCLIQGFGIGISFDNTGEPLYLTGLNITNNTIYNNSHGNPNDVGGIDLRYVNDSYIINNNISSNSNGIYLDHSIGNTIDNNIISFNNPDGVVDEWNQGIGDFYGSNNTISRNTLQDNKFIGISLISLGGVDIVSNNTIITKTSYEILMENIAQPAIITGNKLFGTDASSTVGIWSQDSNATITENQICNNNNGIQDWISAWVDDETGYINSTGYTLKQPAGASLISYPQIYPYTYTDIPMIITNASSGTYITLANVINESGYINSTGYILNKTDLPGFSLNMENISVLNTSNGAVISSGNYTLNQTTNLRITSGGIINESGYIDATGYLLNESYSNLLGFSVNIENITVLNASDGAVISSGNFSLNESMDIISSGGIINESGYINSTGYTLENLPESSVLITSITILNASDGAVISSGNYTLNNLSANTVYTITNSTPIVWDNVKITYDYEEYAIDYLLYNSTPVVWDNVSINYNYSYESYTSDYTLYNANSMNLSSVKISYNYSYYPYNLSRTTTNYLESSTLYNTSANTWGAVNITYYYNYLPQNFSGFTIENNTYCVSLTYPEDGHKWNNSEDYFTYFLSNRISQDYSSGHCYLYIDGVINNTKNMIDLQGDNGDNWIEDINLSSGTHNWYVICNDSYGNTGISQSYIVTSTQATDSSTNAITTTPGETTSLNRTDTGMDVGLDINTKGYENTDLTIKQYSSAPAGESAFVDKALNKYITISSGLTSLDYAILKVYYTDDEISAAGLTESSLRLYYYNVTSDTWTKYDDPDGGVDTVNNYIWANTTHFSLWSIGGSSSGSGAPPGGGGGGGGGGGSSATTYNVTDSELSSGYTKELAATNRVKFSYAGLTHILTMKTVSSSQIIVTVASTLQQKTISMGSSASFDLNADGTDDISVKYLSFANNKATIILSKISSSQPSSPSTNPTTGNAAQEPTNQQSSGNQQQTQQLTTLNNSNLFWIIGILVLVVMVGVILFLFFRKRRHN